MTRADLARRRGRLLKPGISRALAMALRIRCVSRARAPARVGTVERRGQRGALEARSPSLSISRMMPSRRPPLPICSGCPRSWENCSSSATSSQHLDPARVELEPLRDVGGRVAREHADPPRQRLVLEDGADAAAATRSRCRRRRPPGRDVELDAGEEVIDPLAEAADLDRAGRVAADQLLGEDAGADREGMDLADAVGDRPERSTSEEPPPTSTTAISPSTGCPSAFVAPRKESRPSSWSVRTSTGTPGRRGRSAAAIASLLAASRIAAVATMRIAPHRAPGRAGPGFDDVGDLGELLSEIAPSPSSMSLPIRVYARCSITLRWPSSGSATRTRVVLDPADQLRAAGGAGYRDGRSAAGPTPGA